MKTLFSGNSVLCRSCCYYDWTVVGAWVRKMTVSSGQRGVVGGGGGGARQKAEAEIDGKPERILYLGGFLGQDGLRVRFITQQL